MIVFKETIKMGLSACLSECLSTRTLTSVYFVSSTSRTVYSIFKLCICFAHELMCMWFGHSSFFSPHENINFRDLRCSEWVLLWAHLLRFYLISGAFLSLLFILIPNHSKNAGYYSIPSFQKFALSVNLSVCLSLYLTVHLSPFRFCSLSWVFFNRFHSNFI